jgi:hypothetical protein
VVETLRTSLAFFARASRLDVFIILLCAVALLRSFIPGAENNQLDDFYIKTYCKARLLSTMNA